MAQVVKWIRALRAKHSCASLSTISNRFYENSSEFSSYTAGEFHLSDETDESESNRARQLVYDKMSLQKPGVMSSLSKRRILGNPCIARDAMKWRSFYSQAAASSDTSATKVYAPYTVFKGKAALSVSPVLPSFRKLDSGGLQIDRRGVIILKFWPAIGERKYDWEKRQSFALSATEVGSLLSLGPQDSCEFFHDPSMKTSNAGQVRKSLSIKANPDSSGYFMSLSVANNVLKTSDRLTVPLTAAEFAVIRAASGFALPHILGWDRIINQLPAGASNTAKGAPLVKNLEWDR